jgi:glycosyltransferase involved in cell wall biosynthesis
MRRATASVRGIDASPGPEDAVGETAILSEGGHGRAAGPMKVLYFHQHFSTPSGSSGIRSYEMARRLLARGHAVTMVCGSYSGGATGLTNEFVGGRRRGTVDGIDVVEFDLSYSNSDGFVRRTLTFLRFAARSVGLALTERYDVVFATSTPLTAGIPGIFARWLRRKPFVFEVRDLWPELPRAMRVIRNPVVLGAMSILEWVSYRSAHRLVGLSPGIVAGIERRGPDHARVALIPNGCDLSIFSGPCTPWRPEGVTFEDFVALYAGTHGQANGLDAVLDAAAELRRRGRDDIKLLLVGQGKLKPGLQERARREGLTNVVFSDPVDKGRLVGLMAASDVGLQILANVPAFYFGTSPNKFFDYLAAGLPVLINYPGWLATLVQENDCGFAVPPQEPTAFADALELAADDRAATRRMGGASRELGRSQFDRAVLAEVWVDWLEAAALRAPC